MRQSRRIIFIALPGLFLIAFAWFLLKPREPSYQGKTLTEWLEESVTKDVIEYPEADLAAVNAIRQMGTKAIPTLLRYAATPRDSRLRKLLLQWKEKQSQLPIHLRSQVDSHVLAACGFYVLGPDAKSAVPGLTALLKNKDDAVREIAAGCLGFIGPAAQSAVPDLVREFEREMAGTSFLSDNFYSAAFALGKIGPSARSAIPALTSGLTNDSSECRAFAQAALINLQPASIIAFLDQVKDTNNSSNWFSVWTIAFSCGTNLSPAVPSLVSALNSTNHYILNQALNALGLVHQQPEHCIPAILPFLERTEDHGQLRFCSMTTLRHFGKAAKPAVPALIRCLDDPDNSIRVNATNALCEIDPEAAAKAGIK